jgi:acetoin utilization protein AcuC
MGGGLAPGGALFVENDIFRRPTHKAPHPLAIPRVSVAVDLARALGWLDASNTARSTQATAEQARRFHDADYLACLARAERDQSVTPEEAARYGLGVEGNGIYPDVYTRPMTAVGGTLLACRLARERTIAVHHPGGGTHHARAGRASGFCYLNDAVLGLLSWLDAGLDRLVYLDIDAHHGDGVEAAFHDDPRVLTISIHEQDRWPRTGRAHDRAGGAARNLPVPSGLNDSEMGHLMDHAVMPLIERTSPQAIMLQCGADALDEDPQSRLSLSNNAHFDICRRLMELGVPLVVLGGGGYNPWTVARAWAGVWGILSGQPIPAALPADATRVLAALDWHLARRRPPGPHLLTTLRDPPREGPVRHEVIHLARLIKETEAAC